MPPTNVPSPASAKSISVRRSYWGGNLDGSVGMAACVSLAVLWSFVLASCARGVAPAPQESAASAKGEEKLAILAGGCFWCTEAVFERMEGVNDVVSGYIGGQVDKPSYKQVCTGLTGHAEAIQVFYDPNKTNFKELLKVFFKTHDPTTLNRQGADEGTQYRSSVFYLNEEQKQQAQEVIDELTKQGEYRNPIVTQLEPASKFYVAEEYHQDYYRRNPNAGYCRAVVAAKVRKFNRTFGDKIRKDRK